MNLAIRDIWKQKLYSLAYWQCHWLANRILSRVSLEFFLSESWLPCRTSLAVGKKVGRLVVTSRCWYVTCQATGSEWWRFSFLFLTNSKLTQVITWKQRTLPLGYINSYASQVSSIWGLIAPKCRTYALVNRVSIPSDNGLSPIWRQAVI